MYMRKRVLDLHHYEYLTLAQVPPLTPLLRRPLELDNWNNLPRYLFGKPREIFGRELQEGLIKGHLIRKSYLPRLPFEQ